MGKNTKKIDREERQEETLVVVSNCRTETQSFQTTVEIEYNTQETDVKNGYEMEMKHRKSRNKMRWWGLLTKAIKKQKNSTSPGKCFQ